MHSLTMKFHWHTKDFTQVPQKYSEKLENIAFIQIRKLSQKGIHEGELKQVIDGVEFKGNWKVKNFDW